MSTSLVLAALALAALTLLAAAISVRLFLRALRRRSGRGSWERLAALYTAARPAPAGGMPRQTVRVGAVAYRRCVTLTPTPEGLHMVPTGPFPPGPALLIDWPSLGATRPARLYGRAAVEIAVPAADSSLIVYADSFAVIARFLPAGG